MHWRSAVRLPTPEMNVPRPQVLSFTHAFAFALLLKVPERHTEQVRSAVLVPTPLVKEPAPQVVMFTHALALSVVLKEPPAQTEQVRSDVVVPFATTFSPARQFVIGTQAVAGLLSWSHVPTGHASFGTVPPTQKLPAAQTEQLGPAVRVPGAVCSVPAAQEP